MSPTKIEWTEETWNPVTGCTKVSEGCDNCYAERITNRFGGAGAFDMVVFHEDRLFAPLRWKQPRLIFVNSMSDLFHDDVPDDFIARVFQVMEGTPRHTYQILTKRPGRMASLLSRRQWDPLPNVWLGVSVESQQWAQVRIPKLLETPAALRFLSCEPLLGPIDLHRCHSPYIAEGNTIDWVIVGGESGPGARPMHPDWARLLRDQCGAAEVPFFFKQWGQWRYGAESADFELEQKLKAAGELDALERARTIYVHADGSPHLDAAVGNEGYRHDCAPMQYVGKKRASRELDGRTWNEMPERAHA